MSEEDVKLNVFIDDVLLASMPYWLYLLSFDDISEKYPDSSILVEVLK